MTAAVPDPPFRDQLAEALRGAAHVCGWDVPCPCIDWPDEQYDATVHATTVSAGHVNEVQGIPEAFADALLPVIAAELARVQAVANQRATKAATAALMWAAWTVEHSPGIKHQARAVTAIRDRAADPLAEAGR